MKKLLSFILLITFLASANAIEKTLTVQEAGKLKSLIKNKEEITSLTLKGAINDKDMQFIKKLVNLEKLNLQNTGGKINYFPTLPKLKELYLPHCKNNYIEKNNKRIFLSDHISKNQSLEVIYMSIDIANGMQELPSLEKVGLYDVSYLYGRGRYTNGSIPVDTIILCKDKKGQFYYDDKQYVFYDNFYAEANLTYGRYIPRVIIVGGEVVFNYGTLDDFKGINILPKGIHIVTNIDNLDLSDVRVIAPGFFANSGMKNIIFSDQLRYIGTDAFEGCKNLTKIEIPNDVPLTLKQWCFNECSNLKYIHFHGPVNWNSNSKIDGNNCIVEFDKPANIYFSSNSKDIKSPFDHFVFNKIPTKVKVNEEIVPYIELPKGTDIEKIKYSRDGVDYRFSGVYHIFEKTNKLKSYNICVEKPNTLLSYLPNNELNNIDSLTITGFLYVDKGDIETIKRCGRLSYIDLGKATVTYSPEYIASETERIRSIYGMIGGLSDMAYKNKRMNALEHAANKTVASQGEKITLEVDEDKIVTQETFAKMPLLKTVILPNGKRLNLKNK